ncbi:MAG: type 1 periplasmic binding fold superfamily protein [Bacteroidetes bacterium MedPE-SWsnd-G2]|nr:MAG: type 1 periplasmic binding fold superfamily protein [Bacteroidetes bacterium MedPE-SWsnd-G2]
MKTIKFLIPALFSTLLFVSCSSDDDTPAPVNEEELITTLTVTLSDGGTPITLTYQDLDGDGPNNPEITVSGDLANNTVYNGSIVLLNESVSPAEDITEEVEEESDEHQFFYTIGNGLNATTAYTNFDTNGENLGTTFTLTTGDASAGTLTFTLRHEPTKPNTGLADAGGETDIETTFNVTIL